jgi:hypothetical protein
MRWLVFLLILFCLNTVEAKKRITPNNNPTIYKKSLQRSKSSLNKPKIENTSLNKTHHVPSLLETVTTVALMGITALIKPKTERYDDSSSDNH